MGLRAAWYGLLGHQPAPDRAAESRLDDLARRLEELETHQLAHDVAWTEAKDQIARHLKRVAAIDQRAEARTNGRADLTQRLLDLKLNRGA